MSEKEPVTDTPKAVVFESRAPHRGIGYVVPGTTPPRSVHIKFKETHVNPKDPKSKLIGVLDTSDPHLLRRFGRTTDGKQPAVTPAKLVEIVKAEPDFGPWSSKTGIWLQDERLTGEPKSDAGSMREKLMQADPAGLKRTLADNGVQVPVKCDQAELVTLWLTAMVEGKI